MADAVKHLVVNVKVEEQRSIELFTLLFNHGFHHVSFAPSDTTVAKTENSSSNEDASTSRVSSSSTALATVVSTTTPSGQQQNHQLHPHTTPTTHHQGRTNGGGSGSEQESSFSSSPHPPANTTEQLLQSLIDMNAEGDDKHQFAGLHQQQWVLPNGEIHSAPDGSGLGPMMGMPMGMMPAGGFGGPDYGGTPSQSLRSMNYNGVDGMGRKMPYTVRMKGWQRKMLNDAMAAGPPSGVELTELCARCQVTETQAIRFFRKRKYGQTSDGAYPKEDDIDDMQPGSPDEPQYQQPKMERED